MNLIILLFALGIVLLAFEVFVPGAVLGVLGGVAMLGGVVVTFAQFGGGAGAVAIAVALLLVLLLVYVEFFVLPKTAMGQRLFLKASIEGSSQPPPADRNEVMGATGSTLTTLAPSGYVQIEGRRYEAFSLSGHLVKGTAVKVVDVDNFRLIVSKT